MRKVTLFTERDYTREYVAEVLIKPYARDPDALIWGTRIFIRQEDGEYVEGFCATVLEESGKS